MSTLEDSFFENYKSPAVLLDSNQRIIRFTQSFKDVVGYDKDLLSRRPVLELATSEQGSSRGKYSSLSRIVTEAGKEIFLRVQVIPFRYRRSMRRLVILEDETEKANLRIENKHLARLASMGKLISFVAHEISNPLSIISSCSQLMITGPDQRFDEMTLKDIAKIKDHAERIEKIVKSLLELSRRGDNEVETFAVKTLLHEIMKLKKYAIERAEIVVSTEIDNKIRDRITGNRTLLLQVLINLVDNAIEAVADSSRKVIKLSVKKEGPLLSIGISDSGKGIPKSQRSKIFDAFFTTKEAGVGTGLGLAISRRIVRSHGGDIKLKRSGQRGSLFQILLPPTRKAVKLSREKANGWTPGVGAVNVF